MRTCAFTLLAVTLAGVVPVQAGAQTTACNGQPPSLPPNRTWAPGSSVTVYLDPDSSPDASRTAIQIGGASWTEAGSSGLHFSFVLDADKAQQNPPPVGTIGVVMAPLEGEAGIAVIYPGSERTRGARITINNRYFDDVMALVRITAHEMGHAVGLRNCEGACDSVMVEAYSPSNLPAPSACDEQALNRAGGYEPQQPTPPPGGGGGGGNPPGCETCMVRECDITQVCTRDGTSGEWDCAPPTYGNCTDRGGCCRAGGTAGSSWTGCGSWVPAQTCAFGGACCFDPATVAAPQCAAHGLFAADQQVQCDASCAGGCAQARLILTWPDSTASLEAACWRCGPCQPLTPAFSSSVTLARVGEPIVFTADPASVASVPAPWWDLGNAVHLSGSSLSYAYPAAGSFPVVLTATESRCGSTQLSAPQTMLVVPCVSTGCPGASCGTQSDNCGAQVWCGPCCTSSGCPAGACGLHVDNCGLPLWCGSCGCQSSGCPGGSCGWQTDNCGAQLWCGSCGGCQSTGCPTGDCGWATDNCGQQLWCGACGACNPPLSPNPDPDLPPCP